MRGHAEAEGKFARSRRVAHLPAHRAGLATTSNRAQGEAEARIDVL